MQYVGCMYNCNSSWQKNDFDFTVNDISVNVTSLNYVFASSHIDRIVKETSHECTWYRRSALNLGMSGFTRSISKIYREINIAVISSELQMQFGRGIFFLPPYRCSPIERVNISSTSPTYYAMHFVFQYIS